MMRVDIGCGNRKPDNYIGVDIHPGPGVDIVADISQEFPFPDSSVDELRAHDVIEHLPDRINTMNEIWRVCKPGAKVDIRVPSTDGRGAFQDPTHISFWNINSFLYYSVEFPIYIELCRRYGFKGGFKAVKLEHEGSPGGIIHVIAELEVVKPIANSRIEENQGSDALISQKARQEVMQKVEGEVAQQQTSEFQSRLSMYVQKYQQDPSDRSAIANLRQERQKIVQQWLYLPADQLESTYLGALGEWHKIILNTGIKQESLTGSERELASALRAGIAQGGDSPKLIQHLLAAMLYFRADQLPLPQNMPGIPHWLLEDYLKFLLDSRFHFKELGEAENYYRYMQGLIDYFHSFIGSSHDSVLGRDVVNYFVQFANFILLYFNEANVKDIYVKRAEIVEFALKQNGCEIDYLFEDRLASAKKIKLGVLASHFTPTAETFAALPIYEYIRRDFEVILYSLNRSGHPLEQYCQSCANSFKQLPQNLTDAVNVIRADNLDILFIATNVTVAANQIYLMSLHRLARVQVTSVASVVTTGIRHIDYYISGQLTDPLAEAQQHYQEQLVKLEGSAHCFSYGPEAEQATVEVNRENLGISEAAVIFVSGANFFKIIPELVESWAKIIAAVPDSVLMLLPFGPHWSNAYPKKAFVKQLQTGFSRHGVVAERLLVLDPQPVPNRLDVKEYFKIADVYLDSYPFSATSSLIEPLEVDLPIVSRQGTCFRGSMGAAILQSLNVPGLVADSEESYIKLAVALGTNPDLRQQKSNQIKAQMQANPRVLDSRSYSAQMESLFQKLLGNYLADTLSKDLPLRYINLIIFPDWNQSEESLYQSLASTIMGVATHPDKNQITLLIDTTDISSEDADAAISSVVMNLLMEEDLDVDEGPEITLIGQLSERQWSALLPRIHSRIGLENENQGVIARVKATNLSYCELDNLPNISFLAS